MAILRPSVVVIIPASTPRLPQQLLVAAVVVLRMVMAARSVEEGLS